MHTQAVAAAGQGATHKLGARSVLMGVVSSAAPTPFRATQQPGAAFGDEQMQHGRAWW